MKNLAKRIEGVTFGFRSGRNYRFRTLLHTSKPDWSLLATIEPRSNSMSLRFSQSTIEVELSRILAT